MSNLKPFNLERALAGDPMVTEDGRKVEIVLYDEECDEIVFKLKKIGATLRENYLTTGTNFGWTTSGLQVYMAPKKQVRWGNLFENKQGDEWIGHLFKNEEDAIEVYKDLDTFKHTVKIEWEE